MSLQDLVSVSNFYGKDPKFVLAGGGNTSWKTAETLYIKGSGTTLATIAADGFVKMNRKALAAMWGKDYPAEEKQREARVLEDLMSARESTEQTKRPSVETSLHDLFPQAFVVHTHPALINGITCSRQGENTIQELFDTEAVWVEETQPGYVLAAKVRHALDQYERIHGKPAEMLFLQNHGLFLASDTVEGIHALTARVTGCISARMNIFPDNSPVTFDRDRAVRLAPAIRMLLMPEEGSSIVTFHTHADIMALVKDEASFAPVAQPYSPDHIVYCRHQPLFLAACGDPEEQYALLQDKLSAYREANGFDPKIIAVQGLGIFAWGRTKKEADIAAEVFQDAVKISVYSRNFGGPRFMAEEMVRFINTWEVETYRKKISLAGAGHKRLLEKIAIVTGSAQGFGKGIAEDMAGEGANLAIADINLELAEINANSLKQVFGPGKAIAVQVDVGSEEAVAGMMTQVVLEYGGLDIFVSNAGILKAGSLEEMDLRSFELTTKINYTAFFLCTKYASRVMKIQHRFKPDYFMDIIQINSKSGLSGSNKNFAYAGGKFGGIGLTQSFALELVEYRIKVNAICPGNLFDGPLWSDPEKGLFVQYLRAGKVPGAKTIEDVKKHYEVKVPMGRGCEVRDVSRAIFYIVEQEYETGQAVPVTGGQNMLK